MSVTTVSHALNGRGRVGAATRERIIKVAEELGYRANPAALALKTGKTMTLIAELPQTAEVGGLDSAFLRDVLVGAAQGAMEAGYLLAVTSSSSATQQPLPPLDGALVVDPVGEDPLLEHAIRLGVPIVTVSRLLSGENSGIPAIVSDYAAGIREVLDHLDTQGYARPALITTDADFDFAVSSAEGFKQWSEARSRRAEIRQALGSPSVASGYTAALGLLARKRRPDAIIAATEPLAIGAYQGIHEAELRMPDDIGLVSMSDSERLRSAAVPVTALELFPIEIGQSAVRLLTRLIAGNADAGASMELRTRLHVRASSSRRR